MDISRRHNLAVHCWQPQLNVIGGHEVLLGTPMGQTGLASGSIWLTTDGARWTKTKDVQYSVEVAPVRTGFVAVTAWYGAHNALLTSADGQHWTDQANPFGSQDVAIIASDGERAVLLEVAEGPGGVSPGGVWVSGGDAATWTRYQLPVRDGDAPEYVAILGNHVVATGRNNGSSVLWAGDLPI